MPYLLKFATIICLVSFILAVPVLAGDADWTDPDSIDIYDENIGDFIDIDTSEFQKIAKEAYNAGEWEKAAKYYLAATRYNINDSNSLYNLACCYGLLGDAGLAAKYVERAVNAGFGDIGHIGWDPDFDSVREEPVFVETFERLASIAEGEDAKLGDILYFDAPAFFECRIHLPDNYNPAKSYPLIVGLHGYGSNPDRFITLWERFAKRDFIYATPRGPYPFHLGAWTGYRWSKGIPGHQLLTDRATAMTENYVANVVNGLTGKYNVDAVYLMGFSQGCAFTYMAGIKNHELFNGLICFGGWLDIDWLDEDTIKAANDLRVFIAHGTEDRMVEYEAGIKSRDYLESAGYDVTFHEFDGAHSVPEEALQAAEAWING